ncbi:MAG TPA: hypothetical protein PLV45_19405 [bacterium]|nr:hypothetical protein [bacterium]
MRKSAIIMGLLLAAGMIIPAGTHAAPRNGFGAGVVIGEPTGLTFKKWISDTTAWDAGIAWSFSENDSLHLHFDYLAHWFGRVSGLETRGRLPVYIGLGVRVKLEEDNNGRGKNNDDTLIGVRVPFGITYLLADAPIDLFAEIVPVLDVVPDTDFDLNAAIGARFYF